MSADVRDQDEPAAGGMTVGLLSAPELPARLARQLATDLPHRIDPVDGLRVCLAPEPLLAEEGIEAIVAAAADAGARQAWDAVICLTDVPLRAGRHPLVAGIYPAERVGVVAVPAFGPVRLRARLLEATVRLLRELTDGEDGHVGGALLGRRRLAEVLTPIRRVHSAHDRMAVRYLLPRGLGHGRLVAGMVRANRPWRTFLGLWHAVLVALGTAAYATLNVTVWELSEVLGWPRLLGVMAASLALLIVGLIVSHDLWEPRRSEEARPDAKLYNVATALTVAIATLFAYLVLFVLLVLVSALMIDSRLLGAQIHHPAGVVEYLTLAWLSASIATVAGAVGSGLDSVDAVREAAYGHNQRRRQAVAPPPGGGDEPSAS